MAFIYGFGIGLYILTLLRVLYIRKRLGPVVMRVWTPVKVICIGVLIISCTIILISLLKMLTGDYGNIANGFFILSAQFFLFFIIFSEFTIRQGGISNHVYSIPWKDIKGIYVKDNRVSLLLNNKKKSPYNNLRVYKGESVLEKIAGFIDIKED